MEIGKFAGGDRLDALIQEASRRQTIRVVASFDDLFTQIRKAPLNPPIPPTQLRNLLDDALPEFPRATGMYAYVPLNDLQSLGVKQRWALVPLTKPGATDRLLLMIGLESDDYAAACLAATKDTPDSKAK